MRYYRCIMVGIDIVAIERFKKIKKEDRDAWRSTFTNSEWGYAFEGSDPASRLAGIYAGKEAVMKAVGAEIMGKFDRIDIVHTPERRPLVQLSEHAPSSVSVSIAHDGGFAIAVATLD